MKTSQSVQLNDLEDLYQHAPCGLVSFVIDGKIIKANNTLLNWLDITEEAITNLAFTDLIEKGGQFYFQLFVQPILNMHKEVHEINIPLRTPAGSIPCLLNASVAISPAGTIVHAAIFRMNERKKYEVELLKKKVLAEKEKQKKVAALNQVAYDQSHLVRLPLANIIGLISLLEKSDMDEETQRLFNLIEQSAHQLDAEIRKIVNKTSE